VRCSEAEKAAWARVIGGVLFAIREPYAPGVPFTSLSQHLIGCARR
jgi:hypothetical protein